MMNEEQLAAVDAAVKQAVEKHVNLSKDQMSSIVADGVMQAFTRLGVDTSDPIAMQRDFQHLRDWRLAVEATRKKGIMTIVGVLVTGLLGLLWLGFRDFFTGTFGG